MIKSNTNEIQFLNTAKVITIFLVIFDHLGGNPFHSSIFINSFRMPLFFCISGYFISTQKYIFKDFITRKFRTLVIPYFFFAIVGFLFWFLIGRKYGDDTYIPYTPTYILGIVGAVPSKTYLGFNLPIWFLPALFSTEIIFFLYRKYFHKYSWIIVIGSFLIGILLKHTLPFRLPWGIDVAFFAVLFLQLGYYLKRKNLNDVFFARISFWGKIAIVLASIALTILFSNINATEDSKVLVYALQFNNYFLFLAAACTGIVSVFVLSSCIPSFRFLRFYGRNTIIILGLHIMGYSLIKGLLYFILHVPMEVLNENAYLKFFMAASNFIVLAPVIYFINQYIPQLLGRKKAIL
jgi:fucose 4-O-acetylase-like acetyltransferase